MTKEWEKYIPIVASAHEMMRSAAVLCDEARELEKAGDCILRQAHKKDGTLVAKKKLVAKFE
jgi:methylenetetrahydromethanopterin dehydrogenase